jgi:hypothetical protein
VPCILAENETKVKSRVAYEQNSNTIVGFCGPIANHTCITTYKPVVGCSNDGYNKMLEFFRSDKFGGFARVVVVCPLHTSLLHLVLVVCAT